MGKKFDLLSSVKLMIFIFFILIFSTSCTSNLIGTVGDGSVVAEKPTVTIQPPATTSGFSDTNFQYQITVAGASSIDLKSSDIILVKTGSIACDPPAITDGTTTNPVVDILNCTGTGSFTLSLSEGFSSNGGVGNEEVANTQAITILNLAPMVDGFESWSNGTAVNTPPDGWAILAPLAGGFGHIQRHDIAGRAANSGTQFEEGSYGIFIRVENTGYPGFPPVTNPTQTRLSQDFDLTGYNTLRFTQTGTGCPCDGSVGFKLFIEGVEVATTNTITGTVPTEISADISSFTGIKNIELQFNSVELGRAFYFFIDSFTLEQ